MDKRADFLIEAINDAQATIRAIDVKIGTLLVLLLLPFSSLSRIFAHLDKIGSISFSLSLLSFIFIALWLLSLFILIRAISAIDNPALHIIATQSPTGAFYRGGLYKLKFIDSLANREPIRAQVELSAFLASAPTTKQEIEYELAFDHMKVIYIREIKINRLKWAINIAAAWLCLGIFIFLLSRYS